MTISIWRYSHLALAISSSLFLFIASITGIILAFEPVSNSIQSYTIDDIEDITLARTITILQEQYDEIFTIEIDAHDAVIASVVTKEGNSETIYIDPLTGRKLGEKIDKASIFKFATNLHRSLFLKSLGRFFIGLTSFILFLIAITGVILILKRQGSIRQFFFKIQKEYFNQYYHILLGRLLLIPIIIIAITGVYLSLEKFSVIPKTPITHQLNFKNQPTTPKLGYADFEVFTTTSLSDIKTIEFPFSDTSEDYFLIRLLDKERIINQFTGEIISTQEYPFVALVSYWSLVLHTGRGSLFWSFILLLASCSLLFFMYSGFSMTVKRRKQSVIYKNKHKKDACEYILLVGSETGSTFTFATLFANALSALGKTVFISELNDYSSYKKAKHLIILTATYGQGEPPTNAKKFKQKIRAIQSINKLQFSVVGFGSLAYPDFCKYALDIDDLLRADPNFIPILDPFKINNQSFESFRNWVSIWSSLIGTPLQIKKPKKIKKELFTIIERTSINNDETFLLYLEPENDLLFESGDLLAFYPEEDNIERLYSIGKIDGNILLSIKKHEFGVCSGYFSQLQKGDHIKAVIKQNTAFHFPTEKKEVILIANGTGIAPFLGMITCNKETSKIHLFWGGRTKSSIAVYNNYIKRDQSTKQLFTMNIAYSQELENKMYVQDLIAKEADVIATTLKNGGILMICGSIAMQKEVMKTLEMITITSLNQPLSTFKKQQQIKIDCY